MASFLDQTQTFQSYQPEVPIEVMSKIGLYKQQQYDEGVQKIQDEFTSVAGLPIAKEPVKNYLQTKLDDVKKQVSSGIATDFSNQRLVNHVQGLTKQVAADPIVQLGVQNTLAMQQGDARVKKDADEGKSHPSNVYDYQKDRNQWLNDGDINSSFNASYKPYYDVDKDLMAAVDAVKEDGITSEQIYVTDNAGNISKDKNGQPILSPFATKLVQEGKMPDRIVAAINTVLRKPEVSQQLFLDGKYTYRGYDNNDVAKLYSNTHNSSITVANNQILELGLRLANAKTPEEKKIIQNVINQTESQRDVVQGKLDADVADIMLTDNLDGWKSRIYNEQTVNSYINAFSTLKKSVTYESNPGFNAELDMEKFRETKRMNNFDIMDKNRRFILSESGNALDWLKWESDPNNANRKLSTPLQPTSPTTNGSELSVSNLFDSKLVATDDVYKNSKKEAVVQWLMELNADKHWSDPHAAMLQWVEKYAAQNNETPEQWINRNYEKLKNSAQNPNFSFYTSKSYMEMAESAAAERNHLLDVDKSVNNELANTFKLSTDQLDKLKTTLKPLTVTLPGSGKTVTFSRDDLTNFALANFDSKGSAVKHLFRNKDFQSKIDQAKKALDEKYGFHDPYMLDKSALHNVYNAFTTDDPATTAILKTIAPASDALGSVNYSNMLTERERLLREKSLILGDESYSIQDVAGVKKPEDLNIVKDRIKGLVANFSANNTQGAADFNPTQIAESLEKGLPTVEVNRSSSPGQNTYILKFPGKTSGELASTMIVNEQDLKFITNLNTLPFKAEASKFDSYIKASPYKSTSGNVSPQSDAAFPTAYYKSLPAVNNAKVRANAVYDAASGAYYIQLYRMDGNGNIQKQPFKTKNAEFPAYFKDENQVNSAINQINNQTVDYIFNK